MKILPVQNGDTWKNCMRCCMISPQICLLLPHQEQHERHHEHIEASQQHVGLQARRCNRRLAQRLEIGACQDCRISGHCRQVLADCISVGLRFEVRGSSDVPITEHAMSGHHMHHRSLEVAAWAAGYRQADEHSRSSSPGDEMLVITSPAAHSWRADSLRKTCSCRGCWSLSGFPRNRLRSDCSQP